MVKTMNQKKIIQTKKRPVTSTGVLQNISPKTMVMTALLAVMGVLWGRVLLTGNDGPAAAKAEDLAASQQMMQTEQTDDNLTFKAVMLPQLPGRNDTLSHDLFSANKWTAFEFNGSQNGIRSGVRVNSSEDSVETTHRVILEKIAKRLTLESVIQDSDRKPVQAFVDGKILSVGSTLTVQEGPDQYELTLEEINEKEVLFTWNEISVVLKMAETFEL